MDRPPRWTVSVRGPTFATPGRIAHRVEQSRLVRGPENAALLECVDFSLHGGRELVLSVVEVMAVQPVTSTHRAAAPPAVGGLSEGILGQAEGAIVAG